MFIQSAGEANNLYRGETGFKFAPKLAEKIKDLVIFFMYGPVCALYGPSRYSFKPGFTCGLLLSNINSPLKGHRPNVSLLLSG